MVKLGRNDRCTICGSGLKYKKCCGEYNDRDYKNICLLVGNGFVIDFIRSTNIGDINPSKPLSNFCCDEINYSAFINKIPDIRDGLLSLKGIYTNEFEAIDNFISSQVGRQHETDFFDAFLYCNTRRFLANAYSLLYRRIRTMMWRKEFEEWKWYKWIQKNESRIKIAISLNYDLLLEKTLNRCNRNYKRIGTIEDNRSNSIPILKPHGSIDFDVKPGVFAPMDWHGAILNINIVYEGDKYSQLYILPETEWDKCRVVANLIPPLQENDNATMDWVQEINRYFQNIVSEIDAFVLAGFSYSNADRPEINSFIDACGGNAPIDFFVVNPTRNCADIEQLIQYIQGKGHNVIQKDYLPWY
ncbi:MAG: SIR2 family protein [Oscillospiraceae bacterium]|nr:SIR2 family protein [Oscillospiraceae bacterium]